MENKNQVEEIATKNESLNSLDVYDMELRLCYHNQIHEIPETDFQDYLFLIKLAQEIYDAQAIYEERN